MPIAGAHVGQEYPSALRCDWSAWIALLSRAKPAWLSHDPAGASFPVFRTFRVFLLERSFAGRSRRSSKNVKTAISCWLSPAIDFVLAASRWRHIDSTSV